MHRLAHEHDVPTPATTCPASASEVRASLEELGLPLVMKAADPYLPGPPPTKIISSRQELMAEVEPRVASGTPLNMVLQEYIPGEVDSVWMCNGYFGDASDRAVVFTGKKLRQVSAAGVASLAICLPNDTVATQTRRLMLGVGYRGCVGIGWRYDQRDGLHKLLDVNARVSGVFRLFAGTNEVDVVRACYLDLTGQQIPQTALQPGRKWMLEDDLAAAATAIREGRLTAAEWLRSLRGVQEVHWMAADDPVPGVVWSRERVRRLESRAVRRMTRAG
jgi:predicted ATP-grasp superfamily ATP-dependent carboligase